MQPIRWVKVQEINLDLIKGGDPRVKRQLKTVFLIKLKKHQFRKNKMTKSLILPKVKRHLIKGKKL